MIQVRLSRKGPPNWMAPSLKIKVVVRKSHWPPNLAESNKSQATIKNRVSIKNQNLNPKKRKMRTPLMNVMRSQNHRLKNQVKNLQIRIRILQMRL